MSKCIGGVAHDEVGSLATHQPSKSFGELFEEKKAQLDTLQASFAATIMPKTPPMPAVKYRVSTLKGASIIILAYPYRYITRKHNVWARELDIYGRTRSEIGEIGFIPFLYQGQYLDGETGLAYNRFRYYSPETGAYISQDPIRLEAGVSNLYAYVHDVNAWVDPWGLVLIEVNPSNINYSQRTVSEVRIFDANKYEPIRVIEVDGQLVSYDNRRISTTSYNTSKPSKSPYLRIIRNEHRWC